ncbi:MAG: helix-turn-helix transcriptional regulator [Dehalococcoidales bacterium]|nr:helix-turn-helix transcriptional regulator [Dehalococcoidales bacterium]
MQDFIESNISQKITLYMLAGEAGYSPWHSARIFKELTGKTPFDYIRSLRLSRAAMRLSHNDVKVVDVAFEFVFDSHEGFTRAFSKQFGVSPKKYSKNGSAAGLFTPSPARDYYLKMINGELKMADNPNTSTVFVQVVDRPKRKFIYRPATRAEGYFEYCDEVECEFFDVLTGVKDALYEPIGAWMPENLRKSGESLYMQGVEMSEDYNGPLPEKCEIMDLPPCKMMIFQGQPYDDCDFQQAIGNLWEVMKTYNPEIYGFKYADEDGPRFQLEPQGYRGYIEGRPVRQINP